MPTIPAPKEQSVLPEGQLSYQSVNTSPDTFGAGFGAGLQQAGDSAYKISANNQQIKNQTDNVNALNTLMSSEQDLRNGNKDAGIVGYSTLMGQNAVDAIPDYQQKLQDSYKQIRGTLNPAAQRDFDMTAMRIVRGGMDAMGSHSAQQQRLATQGALKSNLELNQQAALNDADDPEKWNAHLGAVQDSVNQMSMANGQYGDQAETNRRQALSTVYEGRTKQLLDRDPIAAADFYHNNIGAIEPNKRYELERQLQTRTDVVYAKNDGTQAYHSAIGQTSAPALPADKGNPDLKPFDQSRIDSTAKLATAKTPWDSAIADAAKMYNVNPNEIRIKMAVESSNNPKAVNPDGKHVGLGQFDQDTATRYGVTDRNDPVQSINGIAKMLAANGGTAGADMSKADRAYFGGNTNAQGPKTDQYVENTRALRQQLYGGGAPAPLTAAQLELRAPDIERQAGIFAEQRKPGDPVYKDKVTNEAMSLLRKDVQALKDQDYGHFSSVLDATTKNKAQSLSDLPPDAQATFAKLSPQNVLGIQSQFDRNTREAAGEYVKSDPKMVNDLTQRVYLPDGDPRKITQPGQLSEFMGKGLNYTDQQRLIKGIQEANSPEGNPFLKQVNQVKETGRKMLTTNMSALTIQNPEIAEEAAYRFSLDLDNKVKAARAAGKDPQSLFTPGSPDYALSPEKVSAFMPTKDQIVAMKANKPPAAPAAVPGATANQTTAINRKTGQRMVLKDGSWQPL